VVADCCGVAISLAGNDAPGDWDVRPEEDNATPRRSRAVCNVRALVSWTYRLNFPSDASHQIRGSIQYEMRLLKYARRYGFAIAHISLKPNDPIIKKLKNPKNTENMVMTTTSGLCWLYLVETGKIKPKLDPKSPLDTSSDKMLREMKADIEENHSHVPSDGYGTQHESGWNILDEWMFDEKDPLQNELLVVNENLWRFHFWYNVDDDFLEFEPQPDDSTIITSRGVGHAFWSYQIPPSELTKLNIHAHPELTRLDAFSHFEMNYEHQIEIEGWTHDLDGVEDNNDEEKENQGE
jgi:hypothetical protein